MNSKITFLSINIGSFFSTPFIVTYSTTIISPLYSYIFLLIFKVFSTIITFIFNPNYNKEALISYLFYIITSIINKDLKEKFNNLL